MFERLTNPGKTRAIRWVGGPSVDQEHSVEPYWIAGQVSALATQFSIVGEPRLALVEYAEPHRTLYFTDLEGWVFDAFRTSVACSAYGDVGPSRYGLVAPRDPSKGKELGGVLLSYGDPSLAVFLHPTGPPGIGPAPTVMGDSAWLFRYYAPRYWSVDLATGMELVDISPYVDGETIEQGDATTSGPEFVFARLSVDPIQGTAVGALLVTDGHSPAQPFLVPPPDVEFLMRPAFAQSHIGWLRGLNPTSPNTFESVELWASPWSPDPANLAPYHVADLPMTATSAAAGGEGWYQTLVPPETGHVRHLATSTAVDVTAEPGAKFAKPLGVTGGRAYFVIRPENKNELKYLLRHALPSP